MSQMFHNDICDLYDHSHGELGVWIFPQLKALVGVGVGVSLGRGTEDYRKLT